MTYEARVERIIDATAGEVFDAYTSVAAQRVWMAMGDDGRESLYVEIEGEPVQGGKWSTAWGPDASELTREYGVYEVFDRPHRVASTATFVTPDGRRMDSDLEQTFEDLGGTTRLVITQRRIPTEQVRDFVATVAWPGVIDRLERYLRQHPTT